MMAQGIIAALIVAVAVAYVVYRLRKNARGEACGCSGCSDARNCSGDFKLTRADENEK